MNTSLTSNGGTAGSTSTEAKVSVAVRVRPLIERERSNKEAGTINWITERNLIQQTLPNSDESLPSALPHIFDHVFSMEEDTKEVYNRVVSPIVDQAFSGFNGTVLCYGQTSSGKTFTLYGNDKEDGILSLTAQHMFKRIRDDTDRTYIVRLGLIEIYNEKVTDLLCEDPQQKEIQIIEVNGAIVPKSLEEIEILKPEDVLVAMQQVQKRRRVGETRLNQDSSRSHTIMRILMESVPKVEAGEDNDKGKLTVTTALLNFVDLAGSEKVSQTGAVGERFKEATHINKSLSVLSQVVMQLSHDTGSLSGQNNQQLLNTPLQTISKGFGKEIGSSNSTAKKGAARFVSYRDSKLTRILQSSLSGNAYIAMICTVTPASVEETISTIRFAKAAKKIQTKPKANHLLTSGFEYQQKIMDLQQSLESKTNEIDDLKRRLEIFMKFASPRLREAQYGCDQRFNQMVDRRKTICSSFVSSTRQQIHVPQPLVPYPSLQGIAEEGIFQVPNQPPPLYKKRSSCGQIVTPFNNCEKFMSDEQAKSVLDLGEPSFDIEREAPMTKKLKQMENAGVQTDLLPLSLEPKRPRLEIGSVQTPPTTLRQQRSQLRLACEEDRLEKTELKAFHTAELEILKEQVCSLEQALDTSEARYQEIEKILELFSNGELSTLLKDLKESLTVAVSDATTETVCVRTLDFGAMTGLSIFNVSDITTEALPKESKDFGTTTELNLVDAFTETETIQTTDFGTATELKLSVVDSFTEMVKIQTADFGVTTEFGVSEICGPGDTHAVSKSDFGAMVGSSWASFTDASTEAGNVKVETKDFEAMAGVGWANFTESGTETSVEKSNIGVMFGVPLHGLRDSCTEPEISERCDIGVTAEVKLPVANSATETMQIGKMDVGVTTDFSASDIQGTSRTDPFVIENCDTKETQTREVPKSDFGAMAGSSWTSLTDASTEAGTEKVETNDFEAMTGVCWAIFAESSTETLSVEKLDTGVMFGVPLHGLRDSCTEPELIEKRNIGVTAEVRLPVANAATETVQILKKEFGVMIGVSVSDFRDSSTDPLVFDNCDCKSTEREVQRTDFGAMAGSSWASFTDASTEPATEKVETKDFEAMTGVCWANFAESSTETLSVEKLDTGVMFGVPLLGLRDSCTEPELIEKRNIGVTAEVRLPVASAATETVQIVKKEFGVMIGVSASDFRDSSTDPLVTENRDVGVSVEMKPDVRDAQTETRVNEKKDRFTMAKVSGCDKETQADSCQAEETLPRQRIAETREFGVNVQPSRVNRQIETDPDTSYDAIVKSCQQYRTAFKTVQARLEKTSRDFNSVLDKEKKRVRELESQILLNESVKENLLKEINIIQKTHLEEKPKDCQEIQCDLMKVHLEKAMRGIAGMLPDGYPKVDAMRLQIDSLRLELDRCALEKLKEAKKEALLNQAGGESGQRFIKPEHLKQLEEKAKASFPARYQPIERRVLRSTTRSGMAMGSSNPLQSKSNDSRDFPGSLSSSSLPVNSTPSATKTSEDVTTSKGFDNLTEASKKVKMIEGSKRKEPNTVQKQVQSSSGSGQSPSKQCKIADELDAFFDDI